jgi:tellurite resistance protein TerC
VGEAASALVELTGLSRSAVGTIFAAIANSLPELVTAIAAALLYALSVASCSHDETEPGARRCPAKADAELWMTTSLWLWCAFGAVLIALLAFDLFVVGRQRSAIGIRESLLLTAGYVVVALLFGGAIFLWRGADDGMAYLTGFLLEKTLSLDNMFVFVVIFAHFQVPKEYQHRVLFWGILGALVMRAVMIFAGAALINAVDWVIYVFAAIVIASGVRLLMKRGEEPDLERNRLLRMVRSHVPMTKEYAGRRFFVRRDGTRYATPLFLTVLLIEATDLVFALDSIPAIFGITRDPFLVYTSNAFAVLGLRALYFALAGMVRRFQYLDLGLSIVLILIGLKMIAEAFVEIPIWVTLAVTLVVIGGAILASLAKDRRAARGSAAQA